MVEFVLNQDSASIVVNIRSPAGRLAIRVVDASTGTLVISQTLRYVLAIQAKPDIYYSSSMLSATVEVPVPNAPISLTISGKEYASQKAVPQLSSI